MKTFGLAIFIIMVLVVLFNELDKMGVGKDVSTNNLFTSIQKYNPFEKNFNNIDDCRKYVNNNSGNNEKLELGGYACTLRFTKVNTGTIGTSSDIGGCLLSHFEEIKDDVSGARVVTHCAESTNNARVGLVLSEIFSPSARMEKILKDQNTGLLDAVPPFSSTDGLTILNINGDTKTCFRLGPMLNCD